MPHDQAFAEKKAIRDLKRIAKSWPQTLKLFSASGSLMVLKNVGGAPDTHDVIDQIEGIPNDGGGIGDALLRQDRVRSRRPP